MKDNKKARKARVNETLLAQAIVLTLPILALSASPPAQAEKAVQNKETTKAKSAAGANSEPEELAPISVTDTRSLQMPVENWLTKESSKVVQERTKLGELTKTTPISGSIIDKEELDTVKYVDILREQFSRIPGVSAVRNIRFPDGGKGYTLNLLDGMIVSNPFGTFTFADQINPSEIERIEVIRGPGSVLYPSNGFGGAINVITREPPKTPRYSISQEYGGYDFFRTRGSATGMITKDLGYAASINYMESNPWADRESSERFYKTGKLFYRPDDVSTLTLRFEHANLYVENSGALTRQQWVDNWQQAGPTTKNLYQDFEYITGMSSYKRKIGTGGELELTFSRRDQNGMDGNPGGGSGASNASINQVDNVANNGHIVYRQDFDFVKSRVYTGLDLFNGYQNSLRLQRVPNTFKITTPDRYTETGYNQLAPFIQYEFSPLNGLFGQDTAFSSLDNMRFNFGLRHEDFEQQYTQTTLPTGETINGSNAYSKLIKKGGLSYEYQKDHVLWFSMADGWYPPGASTNVTATYPNYGLTPEESFTKQVGLRGYFRDQQLSYDVAAYETNIDDYIASILCSDNPGSCPGWAALPNSIKGKPNQAKINATYTGNPGSVTARGFETALSYRPHEMIKFVVAHTLVWQQWDKYNAGATKLTGVNLTSVPKHQVNGRVTVYPVPGWSVEFESDYISSYYTNVQNTDAYQRPMLFNLRTAYTWKNWTTSLTILNVLDSKYSSRVSANAANVQSYHGLAGTGDGPISFRAGIQYDF
ncbi:MAG: hypothetical protein FJ190_05520 [Gammaproteobacteria bacterium]|nr:hypothetical protein [Gammaproteobacteria bacterium]